ncbi:MAG: metallopeptidase family protein [Chloroflexota bacterium]|jgi:predicted Zn-dependent protease with MMP-like domain|nr:metallopeptidase family protein [Chloroflexota bacterium]
MRQSEFERLVAETIDELPADLLQAFENVVVTVEESPDPEDLCEAGLPADEALYGLYIGVPFTDRDASYGMMLPDRIVIYKAVLERDFPDPTCLRAEVRRTVLHEIGHAYGMDEEGLEDHGMG